MRFGLRSLTAFAIVALSAATLHSAASQAATSYPWCVLQSASCNNDCSYTTIEKCRASAAGVGSCQQNPAFTAASPARLDRARR
jgi:hypothetical protein